MPFSSMNFLELVISWLSFLSIAFTACLCWLAIFLSFDLVVLAREIQGCHCIFIKILRRNSNVFYVVVPGKIFIKRILLVFYLKLKCILLVYNFLLDSF